MATNPWEPFLYDYPSVAYQALRPQTGSPNFLDYYRRGQGRFEQDYQAALGQQITGGGTPTLSQYNYLQNYPFLPNWSQMSPTQRGGQRESIYAPRTRYTGFF